MGWTTRTEELQNPGLVSSPSHLAIPSDSPSADRTLTRPPSHCVPGRGDSLANGDEGTSCALALRAAIAFGDSVLFALRGSDADASSRSLRSRTRSLPGEW